MTEWWNDIKIEGENDRRMTWQNDGRKEWQTDEMTIVWKDIKKKWQKGKEEDIVRETLNDMQVNL